MSGVLLRVDVADRPRTPPWITGGLQSRSRAGRGGKWFSSRNVSKKVLILFSSSISRILCLQMN